MIPTKKGINKTCKAAVQYLRFLLLEKCLKEYCIITENNLIYPNKLDFKQGDLCINQLLSVTHEIYKSFDDGIEVRGIFLVILKAFDEV